ncbi:hypothetical protein VNO77_33277 [Canavalia gladiata]|uniref:Disease resistance protein RPS4B/Roq1-like leucine-rich repeats domain-containing protein n=1 Tax=Canavalia gladiata TaxID=3824 RepID=A0AAN9PYR6_CANGL
MRFAFARSDLFGKTIEEWASALKKYETIPSKDILDVLKDLPTNTDLFQNIEELNLEGCQQLPKLMWKSFGDRTNWHPKLSRLTLKNCDLSDEDLELILNLFLQSKWLTLSDNNFLNILDCIEDLSHLLFLVDNCMQLRDVSVLPPYLQYIDARNCISLTPQSSDVILSQAFQEVEYIDIVVLRTKIPSWFDHVSKGGSVAFWVHRKFSSIALFFLLGGDNEQKVNRTCEFCLVINGLQVFQGRGEWPVDHVWLFDLQINLTGSEWHNLNQQIKSGWNHVEISCSVMNEPKNVTVKCCGIHLYEDRMNIKDVSFISPDLHSSHLAHDNVNDSLDIYDEAREDIVFPSILAKYFTKNILDFMVNLQTSKEKGDKGYDYGEVLELDSNGDTDNQDLEEEQHSAYIDHQIQRNCELVQNDKGKGVKYHCINKQQWKLNWMINIHLENKSILASTKANRHQEIMPNCNIIKVKQISSILNFLKEIIMVNRLSNAEASKSIVESPINEDNMEAFYASLKAETASLSLVQDIQPNNVSIKTRPRRSGLVKHTLNYLLSLLPDEGLSPRTKSAIQQLSLSHAKWSLDYNNANHKLESATADLSKAEKVKDDLEANVKDFLEMDMVEKCVSNQLAILQEEKRDLEGKINAIKAEIADFTAQRDSCYEKERTAPQRKNDEI